MTSDSGDAPDDAYWRRPSGPTDEPEPAHPEGSAPRGTTDAAPGSADTRGGPADIRPTSADARFGVTAARPATPVDDAASPWRRPDGSPDTAHRPRAVAQPAPSGPPPYIGPPRSQPPPPGWRPPTVLQPPDPRRLPPQDLARLDAGERSARTLTLGVGMIAGAVTLIATCLVCSRLVF